MTIGKGVFVATAITLSCLSACGGGSGGGGGKSNSSTLANCQPGTSTALNKTCTADFTANSPDTPGSIEVTFSGETLGVSGLPFWNNPSYTQGNPYFVDGWSVSFDEVLVALGDIRVAPGATQTPAQNQVSAPVASMAGPFVVDMHSPQGFVGKDGVEPAGPIFRFLNQDNGQAFDVNTRYSFSYDVVKAVYPATQINFANAQQFADYDLMVTNGWSKLYRGTATYVGGSIPSSANYSQTVLNDFNALPSTIYFLFGWNDATSALNCANPDFGSDQNEPQYRGVQPTSSGAVIAQITLHVDHAFWDILKQEGAPLRFDPIAAWAPSGTSAANPFDLRTLAAKPYAPARFSDGNAIPDRSIYLPQPAGYTSDQADPTQVTLNVNGVPAAIVPGLADFMAFSAQSQMHLNANGLCYMVGQQAADPYYAPNL